MEGVGFEPTKAEPSDLQSDPFDRSGTPPKTKALNFASGPLISQQIAIFFQNKMVLAPGIEPGTY